MKIGDHLTGVTLAKNLLIPPPPGRGGGGGGGGAKGEGGWRAFLNSIFYELKKIVLK